MRKTALVSLVAVALLFVGIAPSYAWDHGRHAGQRQRQERPVRIAPIHAWEHGRHGGRVFIAGGPAFWWGRPYPYWGHYPPPYYVYPPPPVVVQEPPVYIGQPQAAPPPPPPAYWYYCPSARAYYPSVQSCSEPWIKVSPRTE